MDATRMDLPESRSLIVDAPRGIAGARRFDPHYRQIGSEGKPLSWGSSGFSLSGSERLIQPSE
jgi:hypothetical protein